MQSFGMKPFIFPFVFLLLSLGRGCPFCLFFIPKSVSLQI